MSIKNESMIDTFFIDIDIFLIDIDIFFLSIIDKK
jgi:hypothetical protein